MIHLTLMLSKIINSLLNGISHYPNIDSRFLSGKESPANAGVMGLIPGWGRSPGGRNGNLLQYSCLGIPWTEEPDRLQSIGS